MTEFLVTPTAGAHRPLLSYFHFLNSPINNSLYGGGVHLNVSFYG